jgi:DtxR family transcriptional regulator, Mn-dependent transcriptional regulator
MIGRGERIIRRNGLGEAAEDGLKAVYKLRNSGERVSTSALAAQLAVSEPTATAMIKRLARLGLLRHTPYHGVELTDAGEKIALEIIRHHRLLELYLVEALGISWDRVHAEAERLEHVISDDLEDRMDAILGHPVRDPHGDPIPTKDGWIDQSLMASLVDLEPGEKGVIRLVPDGNPQLLRYLAELGLVPNVRVELLEKAPFGGPIVLKVGEEQRIVGREVASAIRVGDVARSPIDGDE